MLGIPEASLLRCRPHEASSCPPGWRRIAIGVFFVWLLATGIPPLEGAEGDDDAGGMPPSESTLVPDDAADDLDKLLELSEEDFGQVSKVNVMAPALEMEVSTVSRQESTVGRSPAAVFVITNEMIRRSGARCIPEVLRMAPGVNVARIDANKWSVSIRGYNQQLANKLLVQIDGRSVYTPLYGGVHWDVQDVVLEDVERIEVIRGPGASVWGANAVNGIINIITKKASDTQGFFAQAAAGTEERGSLAMRYGGRIGDDLHYRVYGKGFERDGGYVPIGQPADDWRMGRAGFRADWTPNPSDRVTFQGDVYDGTAGNRSLFPSLIPPTFTQLVDEDSVLRGGNALVRWTRQLDDGSNWSLQTYYDVTERGFASAGFRERRDTVDIDFQHQFELGQRHSIVWGLGYRNTKDELRDQPGLIEFDSPRRADDLFSYFVQDEITLREDLLFFTLGSKFEHNDYTGFEYQPTARLLWTPSPRHSIWAAASRAVRTPSRGEHGVQTPLLPVATVPVPVFPLVIGTPSLESEELLAYEAGIRVQPTDRFSWDLALFHHVYDNLRSENLGAPIFGFPTYIPIRLANNSSDRSYGFELCVNYDVKENWHLYGSYTFLRFATDDTNGYAPVNQLYLQSSWEPCRHWEVDLAWRYADSLTGVGFSGLNVPSYNVLDARVAWRPRPRLELAVAGRCLLDMQHPEWVHDITGVVPTEVQSEVYGMVTYRY